MKYYLVIAAQSYKTQNNFLFFEGLVQLYLHLGTLSGYQCISDRILNNSCSYRCLFV